MTETTAVYVDGYNFYYGRIRGTPYKWIDVVRLFERLVHEQTPTSQMTVVRYFSAFCLARFSTHGMPPRSPRTASCVGTKHATEAVSEDNGNPHA